MEKPIEVLFEGVNLDIYKPKKSEFNLGDIKENFAYLFVGGEWFCYDTDRYGKGFARLVDIPADYPKEVTA